ncbi:fimbrial protein [Aquitalea sp. USM4]|uniref:fimbrial protein n=1 Tax=Aquitalea sp. USM4 TaxID=1590041 RepID=UPI00103C6957|nr:fimbrial protein [Aquitalea sp. USM4]QBJ77725.1 hypothetical protein DKK66_06200 [Aquitalea sp. USM4]
MKSTIIRILFIIGCLFQAQTSLACTGTYSQYIATPFSITVPGRDAPLVTPLTPWYTYTTPIYSGCPTTQAIQIGMIRQAGYDVGINYYDPSDGISHPIQKITSPALVGIGFIVAAGSSPSAWQTLSLYDSSGIANYNGFVTTSSNGIITASVKIRLIRYSPLQNTNSFTIISGQPIITFPWKYATWSSWDRTMSTTFRTSATGTFTNSLFQTCSVLTPNLQVNLPSIEGNKLNAIGATAGDTPFNLSLNCPSGVNLYITMTDKTNPGQTSNIINLTSDSTAKGVGIQIKKNGQTISMGPDSSAAGNTNQFWAGSINGVATIPLSANYIRTDTVSGGSVKATTTFTLSYQ